MEGENTKLERNRKFNLAGVPFCFDRNMRAVRKSVLEFRINIGLKMKLDQAARWFSVPVYFKWLTCLYST